MRSVPIFLALSLSLGTSALAQRTVKAADTPLPTPDEVAAHVGAHWNEWGPRFANLAARKNDAATLIGVDKVACRYYYVAAECTLDVTASFADGTRGTQQMYMQFDRGADGKLKEVILVVTERKR